MTTLATSRLLLPPPPQLLPILSGVSAESLAHKMHPDKLLMHAHGVTSPRLCSTGQIVKAIQQPSASADNLMEFTRTPPTIIDDDDMVMTGDLNDEVASVCDSEDSDLSVGQENCDRSNNLVESAEAVSRPTSSDDGSPSVDVSIPKVEDLVDPFAMAALRIPAVPVVRPSPTRFQEEFLRKSHIYAEELMKQQMQFMAAARASAFSLRHTTDQAAAVAAAEGIHNFTGIHSHLSAISKMTQMTQMTQMSQMSQITQNGGGESALSKLTAFGLVAQSANSPASSLNQLQQQMHAQLPFINNNIHEPSLKFSIDNILKADFGRRITDPLIKLGSTGGVGGCNTRGRSGKRSDKNSSNSAKKVISSVATTSTSGTPIDLTNVCSSVTAPTTTTSIVPNTHCTNSNDSTSTVFSSNYSTPVKSPTSASSSATTTAASPSEATGVENLTEACGSGSGNTSTSSGSGSGSGSGPIVWPAWVYCTRYSDRPSSGPRTRKPKKPPSEKGNVSANEDKRPRTAFSGSQLARLKHEFTENRYLTEKRRQQLSAELGLNEAQIKIWFQNKRAKIKKSSGTKNPLALQLMAQGLYNHSTIPLTKEEEELQELQAKAATIA